MCAQEAQEAYLNLSATRGKSDNPHSMQHGEHRIQIPRKGMGHAAIDLRRGFVEIDDATDRSSRYVLLLCEDAALSFRS